MGSIGFTVSGDWPKLAVNLKVKNTYFPLACTAMCLFKPFFFFWCELPSFRDISSLPFSAFILELEGTHKSINTTNSQQKSSCDTLQIEQV